MSIVYSGLVVCFVSLVPVCFVMMRLSVFVRLWCCCVCVSVFLGIYVCLIEFVLSLFCVYVWSMYVFSWGSFFGLVVRLV